MKKYYVSHVDTEVCAFEETGKIAVINNSREPRKTDLYVKGEIRRHLDMAPMEICWVEIKQKEKAAGKYSCGFLYLSLKRPAADGESAKDRFLF